MGIQSAVMAEQFGTMFQYGKRRISAMSNDEFNKLTPQELQKRMTIQIQGMIPEMEDQIKAMRPMVELIIKEFAQYILLATRATQELAESAAGRGGSNIAYLAEHLGHGHLPGVGGHPSIDQQDDPTKFVPPIPTPTPTPTSTPTPTPTSTRTPRPSPRVVPESRARNLEYPSPFYHNGVMPLDRNGTVNMALLKKERDMLNTLLRRRLNGRPGGPGDASARRLYQNVVRLIEMFQAKYGHRFV